MSMRAGGAPANVRRALAYLTVGVWSSTIIVSGLLFYLFGLRHHHRTLGALLAAIYLVGTGSVNVFYLRRMRRQWADQL